ncbi:MAG: efflux RND transporter permease subunit, partial [Nitrospirae bacterium]|nr:efflux RND transporter permease subunit [Nitrospirota bacterium]
MGALNIDHPLISMFFLISFLSLIPAILMMFTSFTRIVIVLSLLRQALGGPQIPPNTVLIGISLFITLFVMYPTLDTLASESIVPFMDKKIPISEALKRGERPVKDFMKSISSMGILLIITILIIYVVLGILYESFIHPITILTSLPLAGFGALGTLMLFNMELDVYAF